MANARNIIVGAANFWVGPVGQAGPAGGASGVDVTAYKAVGYTQEGVEVSYEPDYGDVEVDQLLDSARIFKQGMRVTVNTTLAEATLENLLVIWGQNGADGKGAVVAGSVSIMAGALGDAPVARSLLFVGPAPTSGTDQAPVRNERVYSILNAVQTESSSFALRRSEATGLPASFRCLPFAATSSAAAAYGTVTDRAATALLNNIA